MIAMEYTNKIQIVSNKEKCKHGNNKSCEWKRFKKWLRNIVKQIEKITNLFDVHRSKRV